MKRLFLFLFGATILSTSLPAQELVPLDIPKNLWHIANAGSKHLNSIMYSPKECEFCIRGLFKGDSKSR